MWIVKNKSQMSEILTAHKKLNDDVYQIMYHTYYTHAADAASIKDIQNAFSKVCNGVGSPHEEVCHDTAGLIGTRAKNSCQSASADLCKHVKEIDVLDRLIEEATCRDIIRKNLCIGVDQVSKAVGSECTRRLDRVFYHSRREDGIRKSVACNDMPIRAENLCTAVVHKMCSRIESEGPMFKDLMFYCPKAFGTQICLDKESNSGWNWSFKYSPSSHILT